jgi:HAE1 family hydrophobic/amphiphilic exporter-1
MVSSWKWRVSRSPLDHSVRPALGCGTGAEARCPLGLAVVGGLFFSQFVTLYITPVIHIYPDRVQNRLARRSHPRAA